MSIEVIIPRLLDQQVGSESNITNSAKAICENKVHHLLTLSTSYMLVFTTSPSVGAQIIETSELGVIGLSHAHFQKVGVQARATKKPI